MEDYHPHHPPHHHHPHHPHHPDHGPRPSAPPTTHSTNSFWHSEPSALLTGHRSTRDLPRTADVVIIGSGITGASVAHHLLTSTHGEGKKGQSVVMLEAREACWGATGRNGGHCVPMPIEHPEDPTIGRFELANYHAIQSLVASKNIACEFVAQPGVAAIWDQRTLIGVELTMLAIQESAPDLRQTMRLVTDRDELAKLRVPTALGAIASSVAARMWPYKFVARILEDLLTSTELHGSFNLQTLTPVECLAPYDFDRWTVKTPRGCIVASKVVLATNAYTSHLLPDFADLIVPCRGQMSALTPLPSVEGDNRLLANYGFRGDGMDDYLVQRPNESGGQLMFGGGRQQGRSMGVTDDSFISDKTAQYLRTRLLEAFSLPEGKSNSKAGKHTEFKAEYEWTGIMGFSRDELPWVGPVPGKPNVYLSAGYTGHGMPNTWLCGKAVARMVQADRTDHIEDAWEEFGLPQAYVASVRRMADSRLLEEVEAKDWAEMERGRRRTDRPHSGYA
ncbi:FAD dependent oxidoreductase-domain-containing protein [Neohortaea acidophila]|uniref:FAD dependent oxidoreductase-domain-containing protein n=1 Tax=Neohortaea acidophila TaxID=245834 RepID=A0A6A6PRR0_9PEZI|nr:FAD dependent oxidoreductase-domain-containing protein [Neohortaea acidophila]KAF2482818.1 FAD dependent oxidoreductase-domain-containing protein [Neohortaea acidophila]